MRTGQARAGDRRLDERAAGRARAGAPRLGGRVYERVAEPLAGRGAGIVAQPELKTALRALGLDADRDLGVEVPTRVMFARDGRVTHGSSGRRP